MIEIYELKKYIFIFKYLKRNAIKYKTEGIVEYNRIKMKILRNTKMPSIASATSWKGGRQAEEERNAER